jgi:hypothetical protein
VKHDKSTATAGRRASGRNQAYVYESLGLTRLSLSCPRRELLAFQDETLEPCLPTRPADPGSDFEVALQALTS